MGKKSFALVFLLLLVSAAYATDLSFFIEPDILKYGKLNYGQPLELTAKFEHDVSNVKDLSVVLSIPELALEKRFTRISQEVYSLKFVLPNSRIYKELTFVFKASGWEEGQMLHVSYSRKIELTDKINVKLLRPSSGNAIIIAPLKEIEIEASYVDGSPLKEDSLYAEIIIDGSPTKLKLEGENGIYKAKLPKDIDVSEHEIKVRVLSPFKGEDSSKLRPSFFLSNIWLFLLAIVFVLALWVVGTLYRGGVFKRVSWQRKLKKERVIATMPRSKHIEEFSLEEGKEPEVVTQADMKNKELEVEEIKVKAPDAGKEEELKQMLKEAVGTAEEKPKEEAKKVEQSEQEKEPQDKGLFPIILPKKKKE